MWILLNAISYSRLYPWFDFSGIVVGMGCGGGAQTIADAGFPS
jgi:hypothetical protein